MQGLDGGDERSEMPLHLPEFDLEWDLKEFISDGTPRHPKFN